VSTEIVERNISLKKFNTFGIEAKASFFAEFSSRDEFTTQIADANINNLPILILGGGSNILFTRDFDGLVLKNNIPGIQVVEDRGESVIVSSGSGVVWHDFVNWCIDQGYGGVENLSLIPGCTGAAPIQNIGAYGVELKDTFHSLEAVEISSGNLVTFTRNECEFGYRNSIFKNECKGKLIITSVQFELQKNPEFRLSYGAIEQELKRMGVEKPTLRAVSDAVCNIRRSKLPDPKVIGNAGSFFKNPEVAKDVFELVQGEYPKLPHYPAAHGLVKIPAGWLIEQCGWKGKKVGNTGSHKDQALVLVNYGNATGNEIYALALDIKKSVKEKFGIEITPEVNLV